MAANTNVEEEARSIPVKEQMHVLRRIIKFTKPYLKQFVTAVLLVILLAVVNALQPRVIQTFIDDHLAVGTATQATAVKFGLIYFGLTLFKMVFTFRTLFI